MIYLRCLTNIDNTENIEIIEKMKRNDCSRYY